MLADNTNIVRPLGSLAPEIHLPATARIALISFIAEELPRWRDDPDLPSASAETTLTAYLCAYLNSAVYKSPIWDHIQFQTETPDEASADRTIDLTVKPRAATIFIGQRRHTQYQALFPIECKRLPTPKRTNRDEREYVITRFGTTGGIQRFKFGYHGATHTFAAMIAYVQEQSFSFWLAQVNCWIRDLAADPNSPWSDSDALQSLSDNLATEVGTFKSEHFRDGLDRCELRHLWIRMS
jgi:hypothetical protein